MFGRETCSVCGENKTKRRDDKGQPVCADCELQREIDAEAKITCPYDQTTMTKEVIEGIIIDRCPHCKAVVLGPNELDELSDILDSSGRSSGLGTGLALGMVIG